MTEYDNELAGSKWQILKELSEKPASPKQLSEKLNTTIANMSQQLKLLEALGYVKKIRVDKGKGSRKQKDQRIVYSIAKSQATLTIIQPNKVERMEIKQMPELNYLLNLVMLDIKEELSYMLKFPLTHEKLFSHIDAMFYLRTEKEDIHLLIITEHVADFRNEHSKLDIEFGGKKKTIRFWSHTLSEFKEGLQRKEEYFMNQMDQATLIYEKKSNVISKIREDAR